MPILLSDAAAIAADVCRRAILPAGARMTVVGSVRRGDPRVKDIDFLIVAKDEAALVGLLADIALADSHCANSPCVAIVATHSSGDRRRTVSLRDRRGRTYRADMFAATRAELPFALFHFTGPKSYNVRTRAHAKKQGLTLNQYGVFTQATARSRVRRAWGSGAIRTERDVARFIGATYRDPIDRH